MDQPTEVARAALKTEHKERAQAKERLSHAEQAAQRAADLVSHAEVVVNHLGEQLQQEQKASAGRAAEAVAAGETPSLEDSTTAQGIRAALADAQTKLEAATAAAKVVAGDLKSA